MDADNSMVIAENPENRVHDILMKRMSSTDFLPIACEKYLIVSDKVNSCFY